MAFKQSRNDQVVVWINSVMEEDRLESGKGAEYLHSELSNGVLLCEFINKIQPSSVKSKLMGQRVGMTIFDMQRVAAFLRAAKKLGLSSFASFEDTDMRDANMSKIVNGLYSFGNLCHSLNIAKGGIVGASKKGRKRHSKVLQLKNEKLDGDDHKTSPPDSPSKAQTAQSSKISELAAKINMNAMGVQGGLPPSLQVLLLLFVCIIIWSEYAEKRDNEEAKSADAELSSPEFDRPVIPSDARKKLANRKDIIATTNEEVNESLKMCLSECFVFDERMIVNQDYLCLYLRDIKGIDLSLSSDEEWSMDILLAAAKTVFGEQVYNKWGYLLRLV